MLSIPAFGAEFITIGTGGVTGTYYPTGGAICRLSKSARKKIQKSDVQLNQLVVLFIMLIQLKNQELDFGIVQSDIVYQA